MPGPRIPTRLFVVLDLIGKLRQVGSSLSEGNDIGGGDRHGGTPVARVLYILLASSGVGQDLIVVPAQQLHQLGMNEQLLFAERHFAQHAQVSQVMQIA